MGEDIIQVIEHDAEELFKPRPGGIVDTWRKREAQRREAERERQNTDERVEQPAYKSVKVTQLSPEITTTNIINIAAGATAMILPYSPYRYRATIACSASLILGKDQASVLNGTGFEYFWNSFGPLIIMSRGQLWAFASGALTVTVLAESYAPENMLWLPPSPSMSAPG